MLRTRATDLDCKPNTSPTGPDSVASPVIPTHGYRGRPKYIEARPTAKIEGGRCGGEGSGGDHGGDDHDDDDAADDDDDDDSIVE